MFSKDGIHISDDGFECIYQFKIFKKQQVNCFQMRNQLDNNDWYGESSGLSQRVNSSCPSFWQNKSNSIDPPNWH